MPNFDIDYFKRTVALQADGHDIVHVEDCDEFLQITVFDSTDPDAKIAWQGFIKNADYQPEED